MNAMRPLDVTFGSLSKMGVKVIGRMSLPSGCMTNKARDGGLWYSSKLPMRVEVNTIRPSGSSAGSISWNGPSVSRSGWPPRAGTRYTWKKLSPSAAIAT
ncbi:MAG: hypothetical protein A2V98_09355 [Planctomycetes bacterium RBG_16_64_12]|nr:MAG: hypothetical protein A2V98_09355 [Planctomycetes bacterium RBG_16_64_12]